MKPITLDLFTQYSFLSNLQYSSTDSKILFVETKSDLEKNDYTQRLHCIDMDTSTITPFTDWKKRTSSYMMKDGTVLLVDNDEEDKTIHTQFKVLRISDGSEVECFKLPCSVGSIQDFNEEYYLASIINVYRNAIDDYYREPNNYEINLEKYIKEIEKVKTRGLTTFYFNDRKNKDIQEYEGKQYNAEYEFGGKIIEYDDEKSIIEIKNKLSIGDEMEIIIPRKIEPVKFKIEKLWDIDTDEEIDTVNPGKLGQQVKMKLPIKCENNWILRRKK